LVRFRLVVISLVSVALYGLLATRSEVDSGARVLSQYYRPQLFEASVEFWGMWIALFSLYAAAVRIAVGRHERSYFVIIFVGSILFRAAMLFGNGFDTSAPSVFLFGPSPLSSTVAGLELEIGAERLLAIVADVGALALAPSLLKAAKLPIGGAIIHGWNPLVVKEVAGSGRVEVVAFLLLLVSFRMIQNGSRWGAAALSGAALSGPVIVMGSLPLLIKAVRARLLVGLALALIAWSLAFPETTWIVRAGWPPDNDLGGGLTPALTALAGLFATRNALIPLALALALWTLFVLVRAIRWSSDTSLPREALLALGSLVLIAPQVLPWAFIPIAYLAAHSTNRGWLAFTATAPMIYVAFEAGNWSFWLGFAQYFVPYALLIFYWLGRPPPRAAGA
jgi:hypothetical protein